MARFVLLVVLLLAVGCDSAVPEGEVVLEPGAARRYAYRSTLTDSEGDVTVIGTDTLRMHVVATGQRVEELDGLTEVEYRSLVTGTVSRMWYRQGEDRLVEVAYEDPTAPVTVELRVPHAMAQRPLLVLAGHVLGSGEDEGVTVRDDPRVVLDYPLEPGRTWVSVTEPFRSERRIERAESIRVPAGTFETTVVSTTIDLASEGFTWLDWLDDGGLVQRRIVIELLLTGENGEPLGTAVQHEEVTLLAVE